MYNLHVLHQEKVLTTWINIKLKATTKYHDSFDVKVLLSVIRLQTFKVNFVILAYHL